MRYAQIVGGVVHGVFEYDPLPEFAPNIVMVAVPDGMAVRAGWLFDGAEFSEPAPPPADPGSLIQQNNEAYNRATAALTADYPQLEKDTWPTQNAEAEAWVADPVGALTPWIDRAAAERGLDREEYIRRTLIKARQFVIMSSFLTGRRQKYEDEIKAGGSPELDFTLTSAVLAELQQVAQTITITPAADMQEALA